jgi:hypothetical protein
MAHAQKQLFGGHADAAEQPYEDLREALRETIAAFAQENDISHALLAPVLMDLAVDSCALEYLYKTKKPSGAGLKREFERFRRETDGFFRSSQKDAEIFIASFKMACQLADALKEAEAGQDAA